MTRTAVNGATSLLIFFILAGLLESEDCRYSVSGRIENLSGTEPVYIFLVDSETAKKPFSGLHTIVIHPDKGMAESGCLHFTFNGIPEGEYGIRCFQDVNENGELDKGLFGPKEPWGLSWNDGKIIKWPGFSNFSFLVSGDVENIEIELE